MAIQLEATTKLADLRQFFAKLNRVFFYGRELTKADFDAEKMPNPLLELPPLNGGVTFNTGDADVTRVRLVNGKLWYSYASAGDADISINMPSIAKPLLAEFLAGKDDFTGTVKGLSDLGSFEYFGISTDVKKRSGALLFTNDGEDTFIALPNVEIYSSLHLEDGDSGQYIQAAITPLDNGDGAAIIVGSRQVVETT